MYGVYIQACLSGCKIQAVLMAKQLVAGLRLLARWRSHTYMQLPLLPYNALWAGGSPNALSALT